MYNQQTKEAGSEQGLKESVDNTGTETAVVESGVKRIETYFPGVAGLRLFKEVSKKELLSYSNGSNELDLFIDGPWKTSDNWFIVSENRYYIPEGMFKIFPDTEFFVEGTPKKKIWVKSSKTKSIEDKDDRRGTNN